MHALQDVVGIGESLVEVGLPPPGDLDAAVVGAAVMKVEVGEGGGVEPAVGVVAQERNMVLASSTNDFGKLSFGNIY